MYNRLAPAARYGMYAATAVLVLGSISALIGGLQAIADFAFWFGLYGWLAAAIIVGYLVYLGVQVFATKEADEQGSEIETPALIAAHVIEAREVINGELSFAESFRPLKNSEYSLAKLRGFTLKQIPVALGGIAFYSHPSVKLPGLSINQMQNIFSGKLTNWQQLGGPNLPIVPISQDPDAKASTSFLLQGLPRSQQHFGRNVQSVRDTTAAIRKVASTPGAIGYGSQAIVVGQRTIHLLGLAKGESKNYVQPFTPYGTVNKQALLDGTYPLTRRIFVVIREDGELDELAGRAYVNMLLSNEGQKLVDKAGYLPIR